MKTVYFANNWVALRVAEVLKDAGEHVAALVLHPESRRKYAAEIQSTLQVPTDLVFDGSRLSDPAVVRAISSIGADLGLSVFFGYRIPKALLDAFPRGCVNLHPSLLPYNRGANPNVWSIVEGTPAGVSMHVMDEQFDTGPIISQKEVLVKPTDTGESLYRRLEQACVELFQETWPAIRSGSMSVIGNDSGSGTYHRTADLAKIDEIRLDQFYKARDLINVLRARTFTSFRGAYFIENGRKVYLRLSLEADDSKT